MTLKKTICFVLSAAGIASAQSTANTTSDPPKMPKSENGAFQMYADGGWSFGLPSAFAAVQVGSVTAASPIKKTLAAPSFGITVTAWKFLAPFFDLTAYDTGKATASVGNIASSQVSSSTLTAVGGLRFIAGKSRLRGYAEIGGGVMHESAKGSLTVGGLSQSVDLKPSVGAVMMGGGMQLFAGRKWGSDIGFDVFHLAQPFVTGGSNYSRIRIGVFYQTKSSVE